MNRTQLVALKNEIDTDPLVRGYGPMTDQQIADDLNTSYRSAPAGAEAVRNYFLLERKTNTSLYGRLKIVAESAVGTVDPLGETVTLTLAHVSAAKSMVAIIDSASQFSLDLNDSRFDALLDDIAGGAGALIINPADKTNIQNLSSNQFTRGEELGLGFVRVGDVSQAQAFTP